MQEALDTIMSHKQWISLENNSVHVDDVNFWGILQAALGYFISIFFA